MKLCAFIDSGTGGIPYMKEFKKISPETRCVCIGDTANFPYGEKSRAQIEDAACFFVEKIVKNFCPNAIVVACNTMSVSALEALRKNFSVPFVGTVPAIKLAAKVSKKRRIGLLATKRTCEDAYTQMLIDDFAADCKIVRRADADLVSFVEKSFWTADEKEREAACFPAVKEFLEADCDAAVLACTHFLHVRDIIQTLAGDSIAVVDSCSAVAKQASRVLRNSAENSRETAAPDEAFFVTSLSEAAKKAEYEILCKNLKIPFCGLLD